MRVKLKISFLLPIIFLNVSCSSGNKIVFKTFNNNLESFETYYDDSYFNLSNNKYHQEIALASHAMALASFNWNKKDYSKNPDNLKDLWSKEGFSSMWFTESYYVVPETDSIAFGIASKELRLNDSDYTLLAIAVRGGNYEAEWTSNVTLGGSGNAKGFDEASDKVVEGISNYIDRYNVTGHIKLWIAGYSRAAITSNMTAGKIINLLGDSGTINNKVTYDNHDIYAYCFEPPMGVQTSLEEAQSEKYNCIHNLLNYNDLVPLVAPYEWGFVRYGVDHYYPDRLNDIYFDETERRKLISNYHFTLGAHNFPDYSVDDWTFFDVGGEYASLNNLPRENIHPSLGRFCRTFINLLAIEGIMSRDYYYSMVEKGLRDIMATLNGKNENIKGIDRTKIIDVIYEYDHIRSILFELQNGSTEQFALDAQLPFLQIFGANENNIEAVSELYNDNFPLLLFFAYAVSNRQDISAQLLYRDNATGLAVGHMPEISYSFLSSCDSRIYGESACKLNDGTYQVLYLTNPSSFSIFEKNLNKNIFTYDGTKMTSNHLSATKYHDGSIEIYLPNNGEYVYEGTYDNLSIKCIDSFGRII